MPKTGRNIYRRKDGRWEGRYPKGFADNGKTVYGYVYARTFTDVKNRLVAALREPPKPKRAAVCLAEVTEQWLLAVSPKVKPSTLARYDTVAKVHILPVLGKAYVGRLGSSEISAFTKGKLQRGRADGSGGLAPKTVRDILSVLKGIIDFAVRERVIENPVAITYPKQERKPMRVLSRAEQRVLRKALLDGMTVHRAGILLCLYTGLRVGEVCGLRWDDFSPSLDRVSVRRTLQRVSGEGGAGKTRIILDSPKSPASIRDIPVPKTIVPILAGFRRGGDAYFLSTSEHPRTEPRTMQNHFKRVLKAAGIPDANFHCLRHTFSTLCIEAEVDVKSLSEILGHANVTVTLNQYVHSTFEQKREGMSKLERYLGL
ncbi:MAG: site-specific integrase [Kiritimatiellaeota bacterium]|nr:site-specific integrase [Kiritimatiellota bacterium]